jgi:hypothetical protein
MNVSLFPLHLRVDRIANQSRSKRDVVLADLLQSLRGMTLKLGDVYHVGDLSLLSDTIAELQLELLQTSEHTFEGVMVRHRCVQLFETTAGHLAEVANGIEPGSNVA